MENQNELNNAVPTAVNENSDLSSFNSQPGEQNMANTYDNFNASEPEKFKFKINIKMLIIIVLSLIVIFVGVYFGLKVKTKSKV